MRLRGRNLLVLLASGMNMFEAINLCRYFKEEGATLFSTAPVGDGGGYSSSFADIPIESVEINQFSGLFLPDCPGLYEQLLQYPEVEELIRRFYARRLPIFSSDEVLRYLEESALVRPAVMVQDGSRPEQFADRAISLLLDAPPPDRIYRSGSAIVGL